MDDLKSDTGILSIDRWGGSEVPWHCSLGIGLAELSCVNLLPSALFFLKLLE